MKSSLSKEKKKAWDLFSKYIRIRDAIRTTNTTTEALCVTCNRRYPIKELQAGHFLAGRHNAVLFDERNVHGQCYGCNVMKKGATTDYWLFMEKRYGRPVIDELIALDKQTKQFKVFEMIELQVVYKDKLKKFES